MMVELEEFVVTGGEWARGGTSYQNEKHPEPPKEMEARKDLGTDTRHMCALNRANCGSAA